MEKTADTKAVSDLSKLDTKIAELTIDGANAEDSTSSSSTPSVPITAPNTPSVAIVAGVNGTDDTVFVGGLSFRITEDELRYFFTSFGEVTHVYIKPNADPATGKLRGYGFVSFRDAGVADRLRQRGEIHYMNKRLVLGPVRRGHNISGGPFHAPPHAAGFPGSLPLSVTMSMRRGSPAGMNGGFALPYDAYGVPNGTHAPSQYRHGQYASYAGVGMVPQNYGFGAVQMMHPHYVPQNQVPVPSSATLANGQGHAHPHAHPHAQVHVQQHSHLSAHGVPAAAQQQHISHAPQQQSGRSRPTLDHKSSYPKFTNYFYVAPEPYYYVGPQSAGEQ
jgi:hypothetical protein